MEMRGWCAMNCSAVVSIWPAGGARAAQRGVSWRHGRAVSHTFLSLHMFASPTHEKTIPPHRNAPHLLVQNFTFRKYRGREDNTSPISYRGFRNAFPNRSRQVCGHRRTLARVLQSFSTIYTRCTLWKLTAKISRRSIPSRTRVLWKSTRRNLNRNNHHYKASVTASFLSYYSSNLKK